MHDSYHFDAHRMNEDEDPRNCEDGYKFIKGKEQRLILVSRSKAEGFCEIRQLFMISAQCIAQANKKDAFMLFYFAGTF